MRGLLVSFSEIIFTGVWLADSLPTLANLVGISCFWRLFFVKAIRKSRDLADFMVHNVEFVYTVKKTKT